ncbi:MAG: phosphoribosylamine--glycine ligase [Planctomycetota bacterium]|nr:MAG: phosphoribosylamine--glycine ligase [Planctomycetota bacterium]
MNILLVGNGGREHALAWKIAQSPHCDTLYIAPGNPGTAQLGHNVAIAADDIAGLCSFAQSNAIDLTIVGPEIPLVAGIVDTFAKAGLRCWGPSKAAAELEGSKVAMKEFLRRYNIPTAPFKIFRDADAAHTYLEEVGAPIVIKCDGLAAGKGVTVAQDLDTAHAAVDRMMVACEFGAEAGRHIIIEEVLRGEEISVFALCDGHNAVILDPAQDHKQAYDGDQGPNTGGMGAFSPAPGLLTDTAEDDIVRRILLPTMSGLVKEGRPYVGILYMGLMLTDAGPKVVEYNVRFGDPECQALIPRLQTDLVDLCLACLEGRLDTIDIDWDPRCCLTVTLAAPGYPGDYRKDIPISGVEHSDDDVMIFHAGTRVTEGILCSSGGRVLNVTALGTDIDDAREKAYRICDAIDFPDVHYRRDIGRRQQARSTANNA